MLESVALEPVSMQVDTPWGVMQSPRIIAHSLLPRQLSTWLASEVRLSGQESTWVAAS